MTPSGNEFMETICEGTTQLLQIISPHSILVRGQPFRKKDGDSRTLLRIASPLHSPSTIKATLRPFTMTKAQVLALLKENQNDRGISHWNSGRFKTGNLKSFGIGLTLLRKLAKQIGRNHKLAQQLWKTPIYDAKVMGLLIDDPKKLSRDQAEEQVEELQAGMFSHVFASCDATLAKTPFAFELARDWVNSQDPMRRRCGYSLLYELSKKNPKGMTDDYLLNRIDNIHRAILKEDPGVRGAMAAALMGIGKRNSRLNRAAGVVAKEIGPVDMNSCGEGGSGEPFDVLKHLVTDRLREKFEKKK